MIVFWLFERLGVKNQPEQSGTLFAFAEVYVHTVVKQVATSRLEPDENWPEIHSPSSLFISYGTVAL